MMGKVVEKVEKVENPLFMRPAGFYHLSTTVKLVEKHRHITPVWNLEVNYMADVPSKRGKNSPVIGDNGMLTTAGDNARYLRHALASWDLPPIDISDPKQVEDRLAWYFNHCVNNDMKPTVNGMANSLGVHRDTLCDWKNGDNRAATHLDIIKKAYNLLEEMWENYMMNGKINPVAGIFLGKNMFGYQDKQDIIVTPNNPLGDTVDPSTIAQKYAELPGE